MRPSRRVSALLPLAILFVLTWSVPAQPAAAVPTEGHLPVWEEGFGWSYYVDHDVNYNLMDYIQVDHIKENWTRTLYKVLDVDGEKVYQVWEQRSGTMRGRVTYGLTFTITVNAMGSGWTQIRASDMAIINQTFNLTFTGDLPLGLGKFTGGFHNRTSYDPPMPMMEFPIPDTQWRARSTVNTSTEFFVLQPVQNSTWYNTSEVWDLNGTATGPASMTVPAGTYDAFTVHEVGSVSNATDSWPIDRTWYYADEATNVIKTYEGHQLVWTDAVYTPPNSPPEGPVETLRLETDEDVPVEVDLSGQFSDPDGDELTISLELAEASAANATMVREGASWNVTPRQDWYGELELTAKASDPFGQTARGDVVITVSPVNDPPHVVWEPHDLATEEDMPLHSAHDAAEVFDDVDGDVLTYSANATTGVSAFMNGTMVDLVPDPDWTGRAMVTLEARDPSGEGAVAHFELMVGEVNDAPTIVSSGGPASIHETEEGEFWVEVVDTDSTELEYTWSVEGLVAVGVEGPEFTYVPGDLTVSSVTISLVVSDEWNAEDSVSWDVAIGDSPEIVSSQPGSPVLAKVGDTVTFSIGFNDADTPDPDIRWTWNGDLVGTSDTLPMFFGARDVGDGILVAEVDDGVANDTARWEVNVTVPNEAPWVQLKFVADGPVPTVGVPYTFTAEVHDDDLASVTISWTVNGSPVAGSEQLKYTPTEVGTIVVVVSVDDGEFNASDSRTLDVREPTGDDETEDASGGGLWVALVLVLAIVVVMLLVFLRTRPGRQG